MYFKRNFYKQNEEGSPPHGGDRDSYTSVCVRRICVIFNRDLRFSTKHASWRLDHTRYQSAANITEASSRGESQYKSILAEKKPAKTTALDNDHTHLLSKIISVGEGCVIIIVTGSWQ